MEKTKTKQNNIKKQNKKQSKGENNIKQKSKPK